MALHYPWALRLPAAVEALAITSRPQLTWTSIAREDVYARCLALPLFAYLSDVDTAVVPSFIYYSVSLYGHSALSAVFLVCIRDLRQRFSIFIFS